MTQHPFLSSQPIVASPAIVNSPLTQGCQFSTVHTYIHPYIHTHNPNTVQSTLREDKRLEFCLAPDSLASHSFPRSFLYYQLIPLQSFNSPFPRYWSVLFSKKNLFPVKQKQTSSFFFFFFSNSRHNVYQ